MLHCRCNLSLLSKADNHFLQASISCSCQEPTEPVRKHIVLMSLPAGRKLLDISVTATSSFNLTVSSQLPVCDFQTVFEQQRLAESRAREME